VLFIVLGENRFVERAQLHGSNRQAFALEARNDVTDKTTFDRIGFELVVY